MFFKTFETSYGSLLVLRQDDSEGNPEIRFYTEPSGYGLCSVAFSYSEDSYDERDEDFDKVDIKMAEGAARELNKFL